MNQTQQWKQLILEGDRFIRQGEPENAVAAYQNALSDIAALKDNRLHAAAAFEKLSQAQRRLRQLQEAERSLHQSLRAWSSHLGEGHPDVYVIYIRLSEIYAEGGVFNQAESFARNAVDLCRNALGDLAAATIISQGHLWMLYQHANDSAKRSVIDEWFDQCKAKLLENSQSGHIKPLQELGMAFSRANRPLDALDCHNRVIETLNSLLGPGNPYVADSYVLKARTHVQALQPDLADEAYSTAIRIYTSNNMVQTNQYRVCAQELDTLRQDRENHDYN